MAFDDLQHLLHRCRSRDRTAQKYLYDRYAPLLLGVCKRYLKNREDAEDVLLEGFFKIFDKIDTYSGEGSFEGWMRRIMANQALMFLRRRHPFQLTVEFSGVELPTVENVVDDLSEREILGLLDKLPTGYRTVFNLYVLEGFKHREIAELLGISINTSKSQLILAKDRLRLLLGRDQAERSASS
jgi:RNA polymerase sigma factor (sigma-70 family)